MYRKEDRIPSGETVPPTRKTRILPAPSVVKNVDGKKFTEVEFY